MASFKQFFNKKKFEEEIEIDVEEHAGAVYKIPLGSTYSGPIDRDGLKDCYIIVDIADENQHGELVEPEKMGIYKYSFVFHKEKDDEGTLDFQNSLERDELVNVFDEFNNVLFMFKNYMEKEGKELNGFSFDAEEGDCKSVYEKIFKALDGKLEEKTPGQFVYRLER